MHVRTVLHAVFTGASPDLTVYYPPLPGNASVYVFIDQPNTPYGLLAREP